MARGRNSTATGVRFNDGLLLQLKELAGSQGLTTNEFIVRLVEHGLECSEHQVVRRESFEPEALVERTTFPVSSEFQLSGWG